MSRLSRVIFALALFMIGRESVARVGNQLGHGPWSSSMGGAVGSWDPSAFAVSSNPASLSSGGQIGDRKFKAEIGYLWSTAQFTAIDNVVVKNDSLSGADETGSVDLAYPDILGQQVGVRVGPFPGMRDFGFGIAVFSPLLDTVSFDTGAIYQPEYVRYRSLGRRPEVHAGVSFRPLSFFSLGVGLETAFSTTAKTTAFFQTASGKPSSMRLTASTKPKLNPFFGILIDPNWGASFGFVFRPSQQTDLQLEADSSTELIATLPGLGLNFNGGAVLDYDPMSFEASATVQNLFLGPLTFQAEYQRWSLYRPPALEIRNSNTDSGVQISESATPDYQIRDIWIFRLGKGFRVSDRHELRMGYGYRQGIFESSPSGVGNYLDPSVHKLSLGWGWAFYSTLGYPIKSQLNFFGSVDKMVSQTVTRSGADETGDASASPIGAPGYEVGGTLWGGGMSFGIEL